MIENDIHGRSREIITAITTNTFSKQTGMTSRGAIQPVTPVQSGDINYEESYNPWTITSGKSSVQASD